MHGAKRFDYAPSRCLAEHPFGTLKRRWHGSLSAAGAGQISWRVESDCAGLQNQVRAQHHWCAGLQGLLSPKAGTGNLQDTKREKDRKFSQIHALFGDCGYGQRNLICIDTEFHRCACDSGNSTNRRKFRFQRSFGANASIVSIDKIWASQI